ncbi:general transcription factor II-I repeat domain-containing protein 2A [Trichonephila clavipes]|nr:general transcription factor II-I repeat domain-containing protein 2A [Trichonephila clavipes]
MKDRILKLAENVTDQQKNDINSAPFISLCLDESIDITKSARLAVFARYCVGNIIKEELIAITSLLTTTKGTDICTAGEAIKIVIEKGGASIESLRSTALYRSPLTVTVVAFIVFEEGFHQPIKRTKQSVFLDVTVFRHTLVD